MAARQCQAAAPGTRSRNAGVGPVSVARSVQFSVAVESRSRSDRVGGLAARLFPMAPSAVEAQQHGAPVEAGAEGGQKDQVAR